MQVTIQPSEISGSIYASASKSSMQRACAAALVRKGESIIRNPGISNDDKAALGIIKALGATANESEDGSLQIISEGVNPVTNTVNCGESDWSGGAFLLIAGAIAGNITVQGLDIASTQADKAVLKALMDCGCKILIEEKQIQVGPGELKAFHFDATDCPDLFPPLVALASYCEGTTVIEGVYRLTHKESNRALTLQEEFGKMGIEIELQGNKMHIRGGTGVKGAHVHSRHDHRIAMACAVEALKAEGETIIDDAEAVNKSYPNFYEHIQLLGAKLNAQYSTLNVQ